MEVNEMGDKLEEHMCPPLTREFVRKNGEKDTFTFQPLGFEYMPKFFGLIKKMYGTMSSKDLKNFDKEDISDEEIKKFMESMDNESWTLIKELIEAMIKESYPDEYKGSKPGEIPKKMSRFMARNMMELMSIMIEMNSPSTPVKGTEDKPSTFGAKDESAG